jgi:hypothetical protein
MQLGNARFELETLHSSCTGPLCWGAGVAIATIHAQLCSVMQEEDNTISMRMRLLAATSDSELRCVGGALQRLGIQGALAADVRSATAAAEAAGTRHHADTTDAACLPAAMVLFATRLGMVNCTPAAAAAGCCTQAF